MTEQQHIKHTFFYRVSVFICLGVIGGTLAYIGENLIPFTKAYFADRDQTHNEWAVIIRELKSDSVQLATVIRNHTSADSANTQKWITNDSKTAVLQTQITNLSEAQLTTIQTLSSLEARISNGKMMNYLRLKDPTILFTAFLTPISGYRISSNRTFNIISSSITQK